jgi:hypothetical protein
LALANFRIGRGLPIRFALLNQRRVLSRRKPFLLCLRLKSAKQGCFHPRDVLPKQSTASAGFRMAARPLGQRITGDPRGARVHRATTTGPLSPPSASNRVPAPVVDLGRALGRGEGVRGAARGGGAPPCRSLRPAGNLAACTSYGGRRQGASPAGSGRRAAPAASLSRMG